VDYFWKKLSAVQGGAVRGLRDNTASHGSIVPTILAELVSSTSAAKGAPRHARP